MKIDDFHNIFAKERGYMEKLISVIMSAYNEREIEFESSINSILNQNYENIELIIVNDNPQNEKLGHYLNNISDKRVKLIKNDSNIGLVNSLNKALSICNGEYIARMDADDISYKNRFQEQIVFLETGKYDLIGSSIELIDENNCHIKNKWSPTDPIELANKLKRQNILPHPTWFGKKELFVNLNGYRNVPRCEDYDFLLRALKKNCRIGCTNSILLKYRIRSDSVTQSGYSEQYVLTKYLQNAFIQNKMDLKSIENYINSDKYAKEVCEYKKFRNAKENIKTKHFSYLDLKEFILSRYLKELLIDKLF